MCQNVHHFSHQCSPLLLFRTGLQLIHQVKTVSSHLKLLARSLQSQMHLAQCHHHSPQSQQSLACRELKDHLSVQHLPTDQVSGQRLAVHPAQSHLYHHRYHRIQVIVSLNGLQQVLLHPVSRLLSLQSQAYPHQLPVTLHLFQIFRV